jgi:uncharacterized protein (UPF0261 family)
MDWIGVIDYWNEDLSYSVICQKTENRIPNSYAGRNEHQHENQTMMKASQEKVDANTKAVQEKRKRI